MRNKRQIFFTALLIIAVTCLTLVIHSQDQKPIAVASSGAESGEQRIAIMYPMSFGIIFILDLTNQIVCLPKGLIGIADGKLDAFYTEFAPGLATVSDLGQPSTPNLETILKAKPSLILASKATEHLTTAIKTLGANGIEILQLSAGFGSIEEWLEAINTLAAATGRSEKAQQYANFLKERLNLVNNRLEDIPYENRPKVALINTSGSQMIIRGSRTTFGYDMIKRAGGRLMQTGDDPADSAGCAELMFTFDPDLIIDDSKIDIFYKASWWDSLRAVKENKVYKTPADDKQAWVTNWFLSTYSPIGILWLAKKIHPDRFADIDLQAEHEAFCRLLFSKPFKHSGNGFATE